MGGMMADEIKFPTGTSYRPKQLFHRFMESDEFQEVLVIGIKKDGNLQWATSQTNPGFISLCLGFLHNISAAFFGPVTLEVPPGTKKQ